MDKASSLYRETNSQTQCFPLVTEPGYQAMRKPNDRILNRARRRATMLAGGLTAVGALVAGWPGAARADAHQPGYTSIVGRNAFALKAPPLPPPLVLPPAPPPVQLAAVEVTGLTSLLAIKKACLEIVPGPGMRMLRVILGEGEKLDAVEVVSIDIEKNRVTIKNGPVTTNLTFKVAAIRSEAPRLPAPLRVPLPAAPGLSSEAAVFELEHKRTLQPSLPYPPTILSPRPPRLGRTKN